MRRPTAAVAGTLAGTALLVGLKLGTDSTAVQSAAADQNLSPGQGQAADPGAAPAPTSSAPGNNPGTTGRNRSGAPNSTAPRTGTSGRTGTGSSTGSGTGAGTGGGTGTGTGAAAAAAGRLQNGTFAGAPSTNEYGTIRVTIAVSGGRLTGASASFPKSPARTAQVNARAIPILRQEALTAQSARIETVSGASFTSSSYRASLQSALNAARA